MIHKTPTTNLIYVGIILDKMQGTDVVHGCFKNPLYILILQDITFLTTVPTGYLVTQHYLKPNELLTFLTVLQVNFSK